MVMGFTIVIVLALIVLIYFVFEVKRMKHKLFAIFLIGLILFGFFSFNVVFKGKEIPMNNVTDFENAAKTYFAWVGYAFNNVKLITANAIKMNWKGNQTT